MSNNNSSTTNIISINKLLSTCADACSRGCQVIRFVNEKRNRVQTATTDDVHTNTTNDDGNGKFNVVYKVADDPRSALTEADVSSQCVILHCLRDQWGDELNIIGEEDDSPSDEKASSTDQVVANDEDLFKRYNVPTPKDLSIRNNLCTSQGSQNNDDVMLSMNDLTLYIDPMDGTREFVEQRLHNVQCLIGITWKGRPIGGVIGLPFLFNDGDSNASGNGVHVVTALNWKESSFVKTIQVTSSQTNVESKSNDISVEDLWLTLGDCVSLPSKEKSNQSKSNILSVFTGDSKRLHKKHALEYLEELGSGSDAHTIIDLCVTGGCGNKILRTSASGLGTNCGNALSVITPGTCSWDTAAPTAVLLAAMAKYSIEGRVTDMLGGELVYNSKGSKVTNDLGAFVSIGPKAIQYHEKLCQHFRANETVLDSLLKCYWINSKNGKTNETSKNAHKGAQAIDFVRGHEGYVLTCDELKNMISEHIVPCGNSTLLGYSMPEKEAVRETESDEKTTVNKCVLHLFWKEDSTQHNNDASLIIPSSVLYERIHMNISEDESKFTVRLTSHAS